MATRTIANCMFQYCGETIERPGLFQLKVALKGASFSADYEATNLFLERVPRECKSPEDFGSSWRYMENVKRVVARKSEETKDPRFEDIRALLDKHQKIIEPACRSGSFDEKYLIDAQR